MPLKPSYTTRFKKDLKLCKKRKYDLDKLKEIMSLLIDEIKLPEKNCDHVLVGNYKGRRECHITPNWLLIYKVDCNLIVFERTGTHSDLFS